MLTVAFHSDASKPKRFLFVDKDCLLSFAWRLVSAVNASNPATGPFLSFRPACDPGQPNLFPTVNIHDMFQSCSTPSPLTHPSHRIAFPCQLRPVFRVIARVQIG
jgi:hypothetical protein